MVGRKLGHYEVELYIPDNENTISNLEIMRHGPRCYISYYGFDVNGW